MTKNQNYAKKAYAWEAEFAYGKNLDIREDLLLFIREVADDYGIRVPTFVANKGGKASWAQVRPNRDKIRGGRAVGHGDRESRICLQFGLHRTARIVLHELAHIIVWIEYGKSQGHGAIWAACYCELVARYIDPRVARAMIAAAPAAHVKVAEGWRADGSPCDYINSTPRRKRALRFRKLGLAA